MNIFAALLEGYLHPVVLKTGEVGALQQNIYTTGLVVVGDGGPIRRWCFEHYGDARRALEAWTGEGDPPGNWIKQKLPVERLNPNWIKS